MNNQEKNYISKKEFARICETSESSIVRWVHTTDFPKPFQLGGRTEGCPYHTFGGSQKPATPTGKTNEAGKHQEANLGRISTYFHSTCSLIKLNY